MPYSLVTIFNQLYIHVVLIKNHNQTCKYLDFQASYSAESNDKCSKKADSLSLMSCLRACFAGNVGMNPNHFPVYFGDVPAMTSHKRRVLLSNKAARVSPISTPLDCSWETALSTQSPYSFWMARQLKHKNCCVGNVQRIQDIQPQLLLCQKH